MAFGGMRGLFGQKTNLYERGLITVTTTHAQLTKDRLADGRPSRAYRAGTLAADQFVVVDGNLVNDGTSDVGGFEVWSGGSPSGWTEVNTGTGDVIEEAVIFLSGAKSAKLSAGSGSASIYRDVVVKSGEILNLSVGLRGDGVGAVNVRVYNPLTQKYLTTIGGWSASPSNWASRISATWATSTLTATVESFAACGQSDLVTLRVSAFNDTASQVAYVDDYRIWPRVNFGSIHGHNFDPGVGLQLVSSTDAFVGVATNEGAPTIVRPSFYVLPAATNQDRRWWGWRVVNANSVAFEIGESIIGYHRTPLATFDMPIVSGSRWDRAISTTPSGERLSHKRSKFQMRNHAWAFHAISQAQYDDLLELFHLRPEGDTHPVVIVPDTSLPAVIHGRLRADFPDSRTLDTYYTDISVELEESPFAPTAF